MIDDMKLGKIYYYINSKGLVRVKRFKGDEKDLELRRTENMYDKWEDAALVEYSMRLDSKE